MARKTVGYTHLQWTCPACGHKNLGTAEKCASCQAPQPEDVQFEQPAQEKLIQDEQFIERAKAGADIHCPYCGTRNTATATTCAQCGGDLSEGAARARGSTLGAHRRRAVPDVACEFCGTMNPANALACSNCGAAMPGAQPQRPSSRPQAQSRPQRKGMSPVLIGILVVGCIGAAVLAFLFSRTDDIVGRVQAVEWERTITIEQLGPASHEDWLNEIPADADVGVCTDRVRNTQSNPAPGATEICGTPYTVDTGTGLGEVVQDCEYQVYADWCEYTVMEWQTADEISAEGTGYNAIWPQLNLSNDQREGELVESYRVIFDTDGDTYTYGTSNFDRYQEFQIGSEWVLQVNTFNAVVDVEPVR
jgi:DNA-directed RNA polymerase subunit RPC12/RpoP